MRQYSAIVVLHAMAVRSMVRNDFLRALECCLTRALGSSGVWQEPSAYARRG